MGVVRLFDGLQGFFIRRGIMKEIIRLMLHFLNNPDATSIWDYVPSTDTYLQTCKYLRTGDFPEEWAYAARTWGNIRRVGGGFIGVLDMEHPLSNAIVGISILLDKKEYTDGKASFCMTPDETLAESSYSYRQVKEMIEEGVF